MYKMNICNVHTKGQAHQGFHGRNKIDEDKVVNPAPTIAHGSIDATVLETTNYMQPAYTSAGLSLEDELSVPSLEERQAGENIIMSDMLAVLELEGMEVSTPSTEDMCMSMGVEANSISDELNEQIDGYQASEGLAHSESLTTTGFADDEGIANPEECAEDFDELFASLPDCLFDDSNDSDGKLAEMLKGVDAWNKTHNGPDGSPEEDTHTNTAPNESFTHAVDPFIPDICKADLIRCPIPIPTPETDILAHFSEEYARSIRLLKVKYRWYHTSPSDWHKEFTTLISAIDNKANGLEPWLPLHRWLALCCRLMQGATGRERYKIKNFLLKKLEAMARMRIEENKAAVVELLEAKSVKLAHGALCGVKREVHEDCERRGSLLLGTIQEFTNELVGGVSGRWSWVG